MRSVFPLNGTNYVILGARLSSGKVTIFPERIILLDKSDSDCFKCLSISAPSGHPSQSMFSVLFRREIR